MTGAVLAVVLLLLSASSGNPGAKAQTVAATITLPTGSGPSGVEFNPTTNTIYVADSYSNSVSVINGATNQVAASIPTDPIGRPYDLAVNPNANTIYIANSSCAFGVGGSVTEINGATNQVVATAIHGVGCQPRGVAVNPTTNTIYVVNSDPSDYDVSVLPGPNPVADPAVPYPKIKVGNFPSGVAVNPNTNSVYVANGADGTVSVINGASNTVTATISVGGKPACGDCRVNLAVNPNTNTVYVAYPSGTGPGAIYVINGATNQVINTISAVSGCASVTPRGIGVNPTTNTVFVFIQPCDTIAVINGATNQITSTIPIAIGGGDTQASNEIAVNVATNTAYAPLFFEDRVLVINGASPPAPGATASYTAGWNLVGGPAGTVETGSAGALYTYQASDSAYESFATTTSLVAPQGYWAYFPAATTVTLQAVSAQTTTVALPANHYVMVGDPTNRPVTLSGADSVLTYSPSGGYAQTTTLQPGQGAWVLSGGGGTLTITPQ